MVKHWIIDILIWGKRENHALETELVFMWLKRHIISTKIYFWIWLVQNTMSNINDHISLRTKLHGCGPIHEHMDFRLVIEVAGT